MNLLKLYLFLPLILILSQFQEICAKCKPLFGLISVKCCQCGENKLINLTKSMTIDQEIHLKYKMDFKSKLGAGSFGNVYHAYWKEKKQCVALKKLQKNENNFSEVDNEIKVHEYFSKLPEEERTSIIKMIGFENGQIKTKTKVNIVLELGGLNLLDYFRQKVEEDYSYKESIHEGIIKNMLKCAALAIEQFHKHGIHLDIKANNFVIPHGHNLDAPLELCKLIDFNYSIITKENEVEKQGVFGTKPYVPFNFSVKHMFKVSREVDIYSFGVMIYKFMFSPQYVMDKIEKEKFGQGSLDRLAKACLQGNAKNRPSIKAIVSFLEEECQYFSYEEKMPHTKYEKLCQD